MGRPLKGDLTDAEFDTIVPILGKPRKARGGSLEAAAQAVSAMRGANVALTPRVKEARTVSARWVSFQLVKRGFSGKKSIQEKVQADPLWLPSRQNSNETSHTGPRVGCPEPSDNQEAILNGPVAVDTAPARTQVDSEQPGATQ